VTLRRKNREAVARLKLKSRTPAMIHEMRKAVRVLKAIISRLVAVLTDEPYWRSLMQGYTEAQCNVIVSGGRRWERFDGKDFQLSR
jgi:hypothetical protein